jgi:hypothetical protein
LWIIATLILERWDGVLWSGLIWLRIGTGGGFCEHGNEPSVFVNFVGSSCVAAKLAASREGLSSMK